MKRFLLFIAIFLYINTILADVLVLIPTKNAEETKYLFKNPSLTIHFYRNDFVIATLDGELKEGIVVLDKNPWSAGISYYLVYFDSSVDKEEYFTAIEPIAEILYNTENFIIVRIDEGKFGQLPPAKNDGMIRINNINAKLPKPQITSSKTLLDADPFVQGLLNEVSGTNITATVQHLQNYGTRDAYTSQSVLAQQWLATQFQNLGLSVEVMDFTMPSGPASDNVIATLVGTSYPDEYVVLGGHYDSRCWSGNAPGADDNASGTAAVLEMARILSEYEFDRSIIFCAFSGEEYGLYGSAAYASRSAQQGMDILGYFNLDMIGYLQSGNTMLTTLIYPSFAQELAEFYSSVCSVYLPSFVVQPGSLSGGDSDHTSFNNNGFMGIFPFENASAYSPYIHTTNDIIGPSYNNENQAVVFTKATLASVVTMANQLNPPRNLVAIPGDGVVTLQWNQMFDIDYFKIYRNNILLTSTSYNHYTDFAVVNGTQYSYYVTAVYTEGGEESEPSNIATATPMPPIQLPLFLDFENGAPYWNLEESWGVSTSASYSPSNSLTESPNGNYLNNMEYYATLDPINLLGYTDALLSFWTKYDLENNWDFMRLEITTDGQNWTQLEQFTGTQSSWINKSYSLNTYLGFPYILIRFHFLSDYSITKDGMYIDDFSITVQGGYDLQRVDMPIGWSGISSYIIPADPQIENIMSTVHDKFFIIKNMSEVYWPSHNMNTIGNWQSHSGYMVKCSQNIHVNFIGSIDENRTIELNEGWNLIPVLTCQSVEINELFGEVIGNLEVVKDIANSGVYWPSQGIGTLLHLEPGKAYLVKVDAPTSVTFPICESKQYEASSRSIPKNCPWIMVNPTPSSHIIAFPSSVLQEFELGDFVGVFNPDGLCAGFVEIQDIQSNYAIVAYANDDLTDATDGLLANDPFVFKYFRSSIAKEYSLISEFSNDQPNDDLFVNEGLSKVESLTIDYTAVTNGSMLFGVFPNPSNGYVNISINNSQPIYLEVVNQLGQVIYKRLVEANDVINTSSWAGGVYIFRFFGEDRVESKKIIVR
jgi:hypothetical protein